MKAAIMHAPFDVRVAEVADPQLSRSDDAIVRITRAAVCGSDLWRYRGIDDVIAGSRLGHECMGVVEATAPDVRGVSIGDVVLVPFVATDGSCPECIAGFSVGCRNRTSWGTNGYDGGQGEKIRVPFADANLFAVPDAALTDSMLAALLPLTDSLSTGHHAAVCARVGRGSTVVVVGDGAVGLCAVAASRRLGAAQIILISTHEGRARVGRDFGATDIIDARGDDAAARVRVLTGDLGADCALECVGTDDAFRTALAAVREGGDIGFVGVPHSVADVRVRHLFRRGVGIKGSPAPVASYIHELMPDVLSGALDVSAIFDLTVSLDDIATGYRAMHERTAIKALVRP